MGGSIPASAGEPTRKRVATATTRVYPRECGGTRAKRLAHVVAQGLSPRVRGNPRTLPRWAAPRGSIPASAGEPSRPGRSPPQSGVYPRECGGTPAERLRFRPAAGLSPRVRGNPSVGRVAPRRRGSIPASAGEPLEQGELRVVEAVYPRECGGTASGECCTARQKGLSPRVRGNQGERRPNPGARGSIPASAGEP